MGELKISISISISIWSFLKISISISLSIRQFQKYRYRYRYGDFGKYRYRYRYGEVENIDIDIDIDKEILKISMFKEDFNKTSFHIYGCCSELYRMTFHEIYPKSDKKRHFFAPVKHILLLLPRVHL